MWRRILASERASGEQAASAQARAKQKRQAENASEQPQRKREQRTRAERKTSSPQKVARSWRSFLESEISFREELFNEETSLGKQVPPPGPANAKTSPTKNSITDHQRFGEETSLVKRVPPPGPANATTSPTKNRRSDQQRPVVPRCYRTLGDFG